MTEINETINTPEYRAELRAQWIMKFLVKDSTWRDDAIAWQILEREALDKRALTEVK